MRPSAVLNPRGKWRIVVTAFVAFLLVLLGPLTMVRALPVSPTSVDWADATDLANQYAKAQSDKDPNAIAAVFATDGVYIDTGNNKNGTRVGQAAIKQYFEQLFQAYPDLDFHIDAVTPHLEPQLNTQIVSFSVAWTFNGTHTVTTQIAGKATGNRVIVHGDDLLEIDISQVNAKIVKVYSFYPADEFLKQDLGSGD